MRAHARGGGGGFRIHSRRRDAVRRHGARHVESTER
jgi:hypothetical protein